MQQECRSALVKRRARGALAEVVLSDARPRARLLALRGLVELGPPDLGAVLTRLLGDQDPELVALALQSGALPASLDPDLVRDPIQVAALGNAGPDAAPALCVALGSPDPITRQTAIHAVIQGGTTLVGSGASALVQALERRLGEADPAMRAAASRALGELGEIAQSAWPALIGALTDERAEVRREAASALGRTGAIQATEALRAALRRGEPEAARALGLLGARAATPDLVAALSDPRVGAVAAEALGVIGDPSAIPAIQAWLRAAPAPSGPGGDPDPRAFASAALARLQRSERT